MDEKNNKLLVSYGFLATLNDNSSDLFTSVYIPLCKRALCQFAIGKSGGKDTDVQAEIKKLFGLEIPIYLIRQMLRAVEKQLSKNEKKRLGFVLFENGQSFQLQSSFEINELERKYNKEKRNVNALQLAFEEYLKANSISDKNEFSFVDFINQNQKVLSSYFKSQPLPNSEIDDAFVNHANFLEFISENNDALYQIAEKLYLGSIIASFLEAGLDLDIKFTSGDNYYLDTQLILRALDLQSEDDSIPAQELVKIINSTGGKLHVLDITIDEVIHALNIAAQNFNNQNPTSTINHACVRRGLSKTWLVNYTGKIEDNIRKDLGAYIETIPGEVKEKLDKNSDKKALQDTRKKSTNAEHDVLAYLYIRKKREGFVKSFQKAKHWFLSTNRNLFHFNLSRINTGAISEVILPEALTSLLWLRNPNSLSKKVAKLGLSELVAHAVGQEVPSHEILNGLDKNIKTHTSLSQDDYDILISAIAKDSTRKIQHLNDLVTEQKIEEFNSEIFKKIDSAKKRIRQQNESYIEVKDQKKELEFQVLQLNDKFDKIVSDLKQQNLESESLKQKNIDLEEQVNRLKRIQKRIYISIGFIALGIVLYFLLTYFNPLNVWFQKAIKFFAAGSGFFGFVSMFINIVRYMKENKKK